MGKIIFVDDIDKENIEYARENLELQISEVKDLEKIPDKLDDCTSGPATTLSLLGVSGVLGSVFFGFAHLLSAPIAILIGGISILFAIAAPVQSVIYSKMDKRYESVGKVRKKLKCLLDLLDNLNIQYEIQEHFEGYDLQRLEITADYRTNKLTLEPYYDEEKSSKVIQDDNLTVITAGRQVPSKLEYKFSSEEFNILVRDGKIDFKAYYAYVLGEAYKIREEIALLKNKDLDSKISGMIGKIECIEMKDM